jgi:general stress protein 26
MSLEQAKALMTAAGWGTLATTDGRKVGARPMGGWTWVGDELWCASHKASEKIAHLEKVPYAAYCFGTEQGQHVRIEGPCTVSSDNDIKRQLYDAVPGLKNHIDDPASPDYVVIVMRPERIRLMASADMTYEDVTPA